MQQNSQNEIYRSIGKKELWRYAKKRKKLILDDLKAVSQYLRVCVYFVSQ